MVCHILSRTLLLSLLLLLCSQASLTAGELAYAEGTTEASYEEQTDAQSKQLSGPNRKLSYRALEFLSLLDVEIELGTLAISGKSTLHDVKLNSDYISLTTGLSFGFYPSWLEYTLDLGYRLSVDRMELKQSDAAGKVTKHKVGSRQQQPFSRIGLRSFVGNSLFIGLHYEQQAQLFDKASAELTPKVGSASSMQLSLGYRFGTTKEVILPRKVPPGKPNYNDPCRLFKACD